MNDSFNRDLIKVQDELLRYAYKLTMDREEAYDLLQETSLKALDNRDKYTPDTNFKGWMYTIMRNIFINNYRKTVRDQTFVDKTDKNLRRIVQSISWHKKLADVNDSMDSNCVGSADIIRNNAVQSGFEDMQVVNNALKQTYVIANRCDATIQDRSDKIPTFTKHNEFNEIFSKIW